MKLYVKFMVSMRCKSVVREELRKIGVHCTAINLGMIEIREQLSPEILDQLKKDLQKSGLELIDHKSCLVERASNLIIQMIHFADELPQESYADYISNTLDCDYCYLSSLFAEVKGINIQHFIITHKIEKVKELLIYENLSLTEISYKLQYSSIAHLSNQFKKVTGLAPSFFKRVNLQRQENFKRVEIV
ncbi:MAG: AraC family transcriptional regulator [Saprospirales bacterium]|nr:MAG: AraC family transcriptional regulator [Saprospirales bacterium]